MMSIFLAPFAAANRIAEGLVSQDRSALFGASETLFPALDLMNWKAAGREALRVWNDTARARDVLIERTWAVQRDRLDFKGTAQSLRDLMGMEADVSGAVWEAGLQALRGLSEASAVYVDSLASARSASDLGLAAYELATAVQDVCKQCTGQVAGAANGVGPALQSWMQASLAAPAR